MENYSKEKAKLTANVVLNKKIEKIEQENQPALYEQSLNTVLVEEKVEQDLNSKILKITMTIKEKYPELTKYIEEMPVTIPDENHPEISENNLQTYFDSLNSMLKKY